MPDATAIAAFLDALLGNADIPDYPNAFNGLQLAARGEIQRVAAAVDFSTRTVDECRARNAQMLLLHHGMFWGGPQRIVGATYDRLAMLVRHDIAVYASHLPLDMHPDVGNNVLLARELGLTPTGRFVSFKGVDVGVSGTSDRSTKDLVERTRVFALEYETTVVTTPFPAARRTERWGICTGAGADSETIREALERGIDTMIVGEGPHHTAVQARDAGLVVIYAGHYATETLGVRALAARLTKELGIESSFIDAPTGL